MTRPLIHYSDKPLLRVRGARQERHAPGAYRSTYDKPRGLWVSAEGEDDWPSWCDAESFRDTDAQVATQVHLIDNARVLRLSGPADIDRFTEDYGFDYRWGTERDYVDCVIDWAKVARAWRGIIIEPYVWERRMNRRTNWYYTWDCASGCIWNPRCIARLEPIAAAEVIAKVA